MNKMDFFDYIMNTNTVITAGSVIVNMLITLLVASFVYWIYKRTYSGVMYSKNFNITLLLTSLVTAMVMMVIGTNLALSLGMVGALSIIRFRSAIKDPRDIGFLFWGVGIGLSAGTGSHLIAVVGSLIIAAILVLFQYSGHEQYPFLLVIKGSKLQEVHIRDMVSRHTEKFSLRMKNFSLTGDEIIYEVRFRTSEEHKLIERIRESGGVTSVNLVSFKGEVAG